MKLLRRCSVSLYICIFLLSLYLWGKLRRGIGTAREIEMDEEGNEKLFEYYIGTDEFTPPEVNTAGQPFKGPPCDAWTLGTCLYGFAVGNLPFYNPREKIRMFELIETKDLEVPKSVDAETKEVIEGLLDKSPETRMTLPALLQSAYLATDQ